MTRSTTDRRRPRHGRLDRGASAVEYAIIAAGVAVALVAVIFGLKIALDGAYTATQAGLEATPPTPTNTDPDTYVPPPVPDKPTGVSTTSGVGQITITWNAVVGATSYTVHGCPDAPVSVTGTSYTCTGLTAGQTYSFYVVAVNPTGESDKSSTVTASPAPPPPNAPTGVTAVAASTTLVVSWASSSDATGHVIYGCPGSPITVTGSATSFTCTGLTDGTPYLVYVTALNSGGESAPSPTLRRGYPPAGAISVAPGATSTPVVITPAIPSGETLWGDCTYSPTGVVTTQTVVNSGSGNTATASTISFTVAPGATSIQSVTATCTFRQGNSTTVRTFPIWVS